MGLNEQEPRNIVEPGVDICEISRMQEAVEKHPLFAKRHFTPEEIAQCDHANGTLRAREYADRFAGKEAVAKAIGGIPHSFMDICIIKDESGKPEVQLRGRVKHHAADVGINSISLSFAHIKDAVIAVCIAEGKCPPVS